VSSSLSELVSSVFCMLVAALQMTHLAVVLRRFFGRAESVDEIPFTLSVYFNNKQEMRKY